MRTKPSQLAAAGVLSGLLVLGGVSIASAQEAPETVPETTETTPSTVAPESPAETAPDDTAPTAPDSSTADPGCQHGGADDGTASATRGPRSGSPPSSAEASVDASTV